ncbi:MAG: hypothetical protein J6K31_13690 [Parabacteroides sp.]|nr:hypothetical protein [Parabacteroides sp.]
MNKRFSTLLATALVAGGAFSAQAAGDEAALKESLGKYYQLKTGSDFVVIGHGETRDSLAVWKADAIKSIEDLNETLWRVEFTPVKASNGQISQYEMRLFNKVGNRQLVLSTALVQPGKTFYKSPAAVLGAEGLDKWTVTKAEYDALSTVANEDFRFIEYLYSKSADKTTKYRLVEKGGVIKLQSIVSEAQKGGEPTFTQQFPDESDVEVFAPTATALDENHSFSAEELNAKGNNGFTLSFSKDVVSNKYENPFSAFTLNASKPIYSAATYKGEYAEALADVKEAYGQLDDLKAALKDYTDGVKEAIDYLKNTGNTTDKDAEALSLIQNKSDLDMAGKEIEKCAAILAASTDKESLPALAGAARSALKKLEAVEIGKGKKLAADNKELVAYNTAVAAVLEAMDDLIDDTKASVEAVDDVMQAWMVPTNFAETAKIEWAEESELKALTDFNTKNFATSEDGTIGKLIGTLASKAVADERKAAATEKTDYYALAIVDSTFTNKAGKEVQAYLTVDTNYVANKEKYLTFATDTLIPAKTTVKVDGKDKEIDVLVAPLNKNINKYAFKLSAVVDNIATGDSILIDTYAPEVVASGNFTDVKDGFVTYDDDARVVIRTLGKGREISVTTDVTTPDEAVYNTKITFAMPPYASFAEGDVFYIKSLKEKTDGKFAVVNYDGTYNTKYVKADNVFASVPATQWFVKKADNNAHMFTIANRDKDTKYVNNGKVFVIDEAAHIYTTSDRDTFQVVAIEGLKEDEHLGYKYLTAAEQAIKSFVLTAKNYANPEAYYLAVDADSALVATPNADEALNLVVVKPTTEDTKLNDETILTQSYLLASKDGKKVYYLTVDEEGALKITTKANANELKFRRVNDNADEYEVLYNGGKLSINQNGEGVKVAMGEMTSYVFNLADAVNEQYMNFETEGIKNVIISLDGDEASKVAAVAPFAAIKRTGLELKAAATDNDFVLGLDTAYINRPNNYRYAYYITKPVKVDEVGSFDTKAYMVSYADSVAQDRSNDTIKYSQDNLTRIGFVHANRVEAFNNDSLAIAKVKPVAADTIDVVENKGVTPATWAFAIESDGTYRIETAADANGNKYVSYLNGILVLGNKEQAQLFNVNETDLNPTENETIATSEIAVIAGEGQVTIANAAGKKVVVTNVLGQVVANTVLTSDNATIAAPAGVIVVAVEGEEAVKAVVK